jgi:hypothetical protein
MTVVVCAGDVTVLVCVGPVTVSDVVMVLVLVSVLDSVVAVVVGVVAVVVSVVAAVAVASVPLSGLRADVVAVPVFVALPERWLARLLALLETLLITLDAPPEPQPASATATMPRSTATPARTLSGLLIRSGCRPAACAHHPFGMNGARTGSPS